VKIDKKMFENMMMANDTLPETRAGCRFSDSQFPDSFQLPAASAATVIPASAATVKEAI